ncbi:hypothetical protein Tco_1190483, partial [Tanacetum coccineum]
MAQPQRQADVHQDELFRDKYHNLEDDDMVKSIFNSGRNKEGVGMKIPEWMITDEMKLTENYQMTTSAPRSPNPDVDEGESSAPWKSTIIRLQEEESAEDDYELRRREKRKHVEEIRNTPSPKTIRSPSIHSTLVSLDTEKLHKLTVKDPPPSSSTTSSSSSKLSATQRLLS